MQITAIFFGAVIAEALISYANMAIKDKKICWEVVASALIGAGVALGFGIDLFPQIGIASNFPYVGEILTGIIISRGSNYVHELLKKLTGEKAAGTARTLGDDPFAVSEPEDIYHG